MDYEISIDKVLELFSTLADDAKDDQAAVFCRSAVLAVSDWLDPKKDLKRYDYNICYAAATMANCRFVLSIAGGSADVKAGDITIREHSDERVKIAEKLLKMAMDDIAPVLRSKRFAFIKTEG